MHHRHYSNFELSLTQPLCDIVLIYFNFCANGLRESVWNQATNSQIPFLKICQCSNRATAA